MAKVEVPRGSGFPPICAKTGQPADSLVTVRASWPGSPLLTNFFGCALDWIWPLIFCLWFVGPAWLVFPRGIAFVLPVSRKVLWRLELAKYTTWFLFWGGMLTAVVAFIVSEQSSCVGLIGFVAGLAGCTGAYVPAIAFRAYVPAGSLRKDPSTGIERIELRGVDPVFAMAAIDMQFTPAQTSAAAATKREPAEPSEATKAAIVLTALGLATATLSLMVVATTAVFGGATPCR